MDVEEEWFGERRRERSGEDRHGSFDSVRVTRKRCDCPSYGGRSTAGLFVGTAGRIGIPATAVQLRAARSQAPIPVRPGMHAQLPGGGLEASDEGQL